MISNHSFQIKIFELSGLWLILLLVRYLTDNHIPRIQLISNHY